MKPEDMPKDIKRMEEWLKERLDGLSLEEQVEALKETIFAMEESAFKMATDVMDMTAHYNAEIKAINEKVVKIAKHIGVEEFAKLMGETEADTGD